MPTLPPGPRSSLWGMVQYLRDPLECMVPLAKQYGDPFTFPGSPPLVCVGDPAGLKALYSAEPDTFMPMNQDMELFLGRHSLLLVGGPEHRRARKLMTPPFHGARMRAYGETICRIAEHQSAALVAGARFSALELMQELSLEVILQTVFGLHEPVARKALATTVLEVVNNLSPLLLFMPSLRHDFGGLGPFAAFKKRQLRLHEQLDALTTAARAVEPRDDILSQLVHARYEDGEPMSNDELRDQLLLLIIAGHETTAISLAWALYALHRPENAAVLEKLRAELATLGPEPSPEKLDKLPYLDAVCQETHRRYPLAPAPSPRKLQRPFELMGYTLPAGVGVAGAIGVAHRREETYPEPLRFRPERFLERKFSPFEFLPFGGGARRCLGAALASFEMRLVVGTLLRRFRLTLASPRPETGKVRGANVGPAHGVQMVVESRAA